MSHSPSTAIQKLWMASAVQEIDWEVGNEGDGGQPLTIEPGAAVEQIPSGGRWGQAEISLFVSHLHHHHITVKGTITRAMGGCFC